ncbi:hypothetical protein ABPG75_000384 [Micractinium tetrahymenae]
MISELVKAEAGTHHLLSAPEAATADAGTAAALAAAAWEQHSRTCRLVHFILHSPPAQQQLLHGCLPSGWVFLADRLGRGLLSLVHVLLQAHAKGTPDKEHLLSLRQQVCSASAAHLEALAALAPSLSLAELASENVLHSVFAAATTAPWVVLHAPGSRHLLGLAVLAGVKGNERQPSLWGWLADCSQAAGGCSVQLIAELLQTGLLAGMLDSCMRQHLSGQADGQAVANVATLLWDWVLLLWAAVRGMAQGEGSEGPGHVSGSVACSAAADGSKAAGSTASAAVNEVMQRMSAAEQRLGSCLRRNDGSLEKLRLLQAAMPAATEAAAALQAWWDLPTQQQAAQLELGQAAGLRACAFLGCANLQAQGGAGAGRGEGSKRCGGCRSVWYCGTECSHADWPAHRRATSCWLPGGRRSGQAGCRRRWEEAGESDPLAPLSPNLYSRIASIHLYLLLVLKRRIGVSCLKAGRAAGRLPARQLRRQAATPASPLTLVLLPDTALPLLDLSSRIPI